MIETLISFISLILVCVLAYFSTRYYAKMMSKTQKSDSMQVMESMMLERDKRIIIVKILDKYYTLVSHSNGVENLGECEYIEKPKNEQAGNRFDLLLKQFVRKGDRHE